VTFTFAEDGGRFRAPDGTPAETFLAGIAADGAAATGVNCVFAGGPLAALAGWAAERLAVPFVAKPSPGLPGAVLAPEAFARALRPALDAGLAIVGGCCGATGDHLRAIAPLLARYIRRPLIPSRSPLTPSLSPACAGEREILLPR
jgi:5-methyltetrahydrofolate--homocysteine methyltransferase